MQDDRRRTLRARINLKKRTDIDAVLLAAQFRRAKAEADEISIKVLLECSDRLMLEATGLSEK